MHGARLSLAMAEIMWLVISIGALSIVGLVAGFFAQNASDTAKPKADEESDSEQGAVDDPHSEEYTR